MNHQKQTTPREKNTCGPSSEAEMLSPVIDGMMRPIHIDSFFASILEEVTPMLQQAAAEEHGRLIRQGKARAKARRAAANENREATDPTSPSREVASD